MKLSDFDYLLPDELIARYPPALRDGSRLLVLHKDTSEIEDRNFPDCIQYLNQGDVLVLNETKVIPARLAGTRETTGARVEIFLLQKQADRTDTWHVLAAPAKKVKVREKIIITRNLSCEVLEELTEGERIVRFFLNEFHSENLENPSASRFRQSIEDALDEAGKMPIPPYLKREAEDIDKERYQTVFATVSGAVAAPTASLHFTAELLSRIEAAGIRIVKVLLHVGLGTFRPVEVENIEEHTMHSEYFEVSAETAVALNTARESGGRIVAIGTTAARTLESTANEHGEIIARKGETAIFIYPPYKFKAVDILVTNFHQPKSSLIMMVSALAGYNNIMKAYQHAIREKYRFLSYGDAMMII